MDLSHQIFKNSIKYLHQISEALPLEYRAAKSYYASKCRIFELRGNLYLPHSVTKSSVRCSRCCLSFNDYPPSVVISKKKIHKFTKNVLGKLEDGRTLTNFQQKYIKRVKSSEGVEIKKTCQICQKETDIEIKMSETFRNKCISDNISLPNRKKKKKDKFCGLNRDICETIEAKCDDNTRKPRKTTFDKVKMILDNQRMVKKPKENKKKQISTKDKIIEKKKNKAKQKVKSKLSNLLNNSGKGKKTSNLKNFLEDLGVKK